MNARDPVEAARRALHLSLDDLARVVGASPRELRELSEDGGDSQEGTLNRLAEVLGVEVSELFQGGLEQRPAAAMLRSFVDDGGGAFDELVAQGLHRELGGFARRARRKAWLRKLLGHAPPRAALEGRPVAIAVDERPPFRAEALADEARAGLGLGDAPVDGMLALLREGLGVDVQFTTTLWGRVDGASVSTGDARAVLVNVGGGRGGAWRRTRATLAHELCHLLFDRGAFEGSSSTLIFSPAAQPRAAGDGELSPRFGAQHAAFRRVEQRANAFAAHFLAPREGVRRLFDGREPAQTPASVRALAERFGVSPLTATNHLTNLYRWSPGMRLALLDEVDRAAESREPSGDHPDAVLVVPTEDVELRLLAHEAEARGLILAATCARWLGEDRDDAHIAPADGDRPVGYWSWRSPDEALGELRNFLQADDVGAALNVLWDAFHDWHDAGDLGSCRALVAALPPDAVNSHVMASVLALTAAPGELAEERRTYRRAAAEALRARGWADAQIVAALGAEPDVAA